MKSSKLLAIVLCLTIALIGCGKAATPSTDSSAAPAADVTAAPAATEAPAEDISTKKISISVAFPAIDNKDATAAEEDKVKRFIAKYPNVTITPDAWQYNETEIGAKGAGNQLATVYRTYATEGKFLIDKGWAADITDLVSAYEFGDQFNANLLNQFKIDNKIYAVPQQGYVVGVGLNKKMLDAKGVAIPPADWTWADLLATAKAVADPAKGIAGIAPMGNTNASGWNWTNFLYTAGGEIETIAADGKVTAAFNSDAGVKALDFYKSLKAANVIPSDWATLGWGEAMGAFAQGKSAMVIGGVDGPAAQALNQGGVLPSDILIYPVPVLAAGGKHYGVLGGDFFVFNPKASKDEIEMAFRYVTFDLFKQEGIDSREKDIQDRKKNNKFYVPNALEYFNPDSDYGIKMKAMYDKYDNVFQYSADLNKLAVGKPEAQFGGQDFYAEATKMVQAVFTNKDANSKDLLDAAAKAFQAKLDAIKK